MLIVKFIGVAVLVGLAVRWKRMRPLLLGLLLLVLLLRIFGQLASIAPRNRLGPAAAGDLGQVIPGAVPSESPDAGPLDPINPGCPDPTTCGDPLGQGGGSTL